ncbi:hypothetical protein ABW20_dc0102136 [Dactylellina cionopaga]|nr:hypothetical protein ABW20_dc0102136 [Dactylellina cionopaga]
MFYKFPNIEIGLLVGTGGGAPNMDNDIRLGDIVVSCPSATGNNGGVVEYDFGSTVQGQPFQRTRFLNQPPRRLRSAVIALEVKYERRGHQIQASIENLLAEKPGMESFRRPATWMTQQSTTVVSDPETLS